MMETKERKKITIDMLINDTPSKGDTFTREHDGYRINIKSSLREELFFFFSRKAYFSVECSSSIK